MIHYVKTKKCITIDNTIDNILYVGDVSESWSPYVTKHNLEWVGGCFKSLLQRHDNEYIIDLERDFKLNKSHFQTKIDSDVLYQFCSNIRQFKINDLVYDIESTIYKRQYRK